MICIFQKYTTSGMQSLFLETFHNKKAEDGAYNLFLAIKHNL